MATSFKIKAVTELRAAKKIARQQEATAQAEYEENKAAKLLANEKRRADKMVRISQPEPTPAPVNEAVKIGDLTELLKTPDVNGLTVVSLESEEDSKLTVVEVTLANCPEKIASPVTPALTTVKTGELAGSPAEFVIVF